VPDPARFARAVLELRVRYAETDKFGIVHHSCYVPWFESGRIELLRQLGADYKDVEAKGLAFPLTELVFRYHAPARLDETLRIETVFLGLDRFRVTFGCKIVGPGERLLSRAYSVHALVDTAMSVREIPPDLVAVVGPNLAPGDYLGKRFGPRAGPRAV